MPVTRSYYWDNLKGILILFVVLGHLCELYIYDSSLLEHAWTIIYSFHMPLFIFVNGYFARKSSKTGKGKAIKMLGYYLLMQVLFDVGQVFILKESFDRDLIVNPEYCCWYLLFLVYAYLITDYMPKNKRNLIKWAGIALVISLLIGFDASVGHSYGIGRTFYFLPYFIGGSIAYEYISTTGIAINKKRVHNSLYVIVLIIMVVFLWVLGDMSWFNRTTFAGYLPYYELYPDNIFSGMVLKLGAYLIAVIMGYLILKIVPKCKTFFAVLGKHTLTIYLVHIFLLPMLFPFVNEIPLFDNIYIHAMLVMFVLVVVTAVVVITINLLNGRIFPKAVADK